MNSSDGEDEFSYTYREYQQAPYNHPELKRRRKKLDKVWNKISKGKYCQSLWRNDQIRKKSNRWLYGSEIPKKLDQAFQEALVAQLSLTLELIPESEPVPYTDKFALDLHISSLLRK